MEIFKLSGYGSVLAGRECGRNIGQDLMRLIERSGGYDTVIMDLDGLEAVDYAAMDEIIRVADFMAYSGFLYPNRSLVLAGGKSNVVEELELSLKQRELNCFYFQTSVDYGKDNYRILGTLKPHLEDTLIALEKSGGSDAKALADVLGIGVTNCHNRLKELMRTGLVCKHIPGHSNNRKVIYRVRIAKYLRDKLLAAKL